MPLETLDDLLTFSGSLGEILRQDARAQFMNETMDLVAHARAQTLLTLVLAEIEPAREAAAAAQEAAAAAKQAARDALELLQAAKEGERTELYNAHAAAARNSQRLQTASQLADQRAKQLVWLETSLQALEKPQIDTLKILFDEVQK